MWNGLYVVINQLIKSIGKAIHLNKSLTYMLRGKNISIEQKMTKKGILKIRSKSSHSKVHNYLLVKIFVTVKN
jgi:hypothetical protein